LNFARHSSGHEQGMNASSDVVRQPLRCADYGCKGMAIRASSWSGAVTGPGAICGASLG